MVQRDEIKFCFLFGQRASRSLAKHGDKYSWEYVLVYVDDVLVVFHNPQKMMEALSAKYTLKAGSGAM